MSYLDLMFARTPLWFPCGDCGQNTVREYYAVQNAVWAEAHGESYVRGGFLCIGCLEGRLGRELTRADFKAVPVNALNTSKMSARLVDRLCRGLESATQG